MVRTSLCVLHGGSTRPLLLLATESAWRSEPTFGVGVSWYLGRLGGVIGDLNGRSAWRPNLSALGVGSRDCDLPFVYRPAGPW